MFSPGLPLGLENLEAASTTSLLFENNVENAVLAKAMVAVVFARLKSEINSEKLMISLALIAV